MNASRLALASTTLLMFLLVALTFPTLGCSGTSGPRPADRLWNELGCVNCHGPDGSGMPGFGPTLHGKKSFWTRDQLVAYLRDPVGYAQKDARLRQQAHGYMSPMPPVTSPDPVEVERIADRVLAMP